MDLVLRIHATNSRRPLPEPGTAPQPAPASLHSNLASMERQASFDSPVIGRRAGNAGGASVGVGVSEARRGDDMVSIHSRYRARYTDTCVFAERHYKGGRVQPEDARGPVP